MLTTVVFLSLANIAQRFILPPAQARIHSLFTECECLPLSKEALCGREGLLFEGLFDPFESIKKSVPMTTLSPPPTP